MRKTMLLGLMAGLAALGAHAAPAAYHVETRIALPDGGWDLASFDPITRRVYLARPDSVVAVEAEGGKVSRLGEAKVAHAAIPVNGGAEVLVTNGATDEARFLDAKTGAVVATVKTGKWPDAAVLDPATGLAVVMAARGGDVTLIDPKTHAVAGTIAVGGALELAAPDGQGRVFLNVEDKNELVVLDLKARTAKHLALPGCDGPTGIAYLRASHMVMSACGNEVAALTDAGTLKAGPRLPIGKGPDTVMYDAVRHRALVPCGRSGELAVFDDSAKGVTAAGRAPTQLGARTGAVDEKTGRVYLPAADYGPPATPNGRPQMKPGSVVMVVLAP